MHLFAPGSSVALCGDRVTKIMPCLRGEASCVKCLVRHDAMLMHGWKQTKWHGFTNGIRYVMWDQTKHPNITFERRPRLSWYVEREMWDKDTLKAARKMAKLHPDFGDV